MAITAKEYLDWWNSHNPGQRATIDQIEPCACGNKACQGFYVVKRDKYVEKTCKLVKKT